MPTRPRNPLSVQLLDVIAELEANPNPATMARLKRVSAEITSLLDQQYRIGLEKRGPEPSVDLDAVHRTCGG